ncbi:MAG: hypothetical protein RLZZ292_2587 [Bacteroidota bacterium]|jgi:hypothetical protein
MKQITNHLLMIRPANFGFNEETAASNAFQSNDTSLSISEISERAKNEFDTFVQKLRAVGVDVTVYNEPETPIKPDSIFPNNWVSFHEIDTIVTYPMFAAVRRLERDEAVLTMLAQKFNVKERYHLEQYEGENKFLEGTGSLLLDRQNGFAYACISPRTDLSVLDAFCTLRNYSPVSFTATDGNHQQIYHTNVMMALGESFAVLCLDTIQDEAERKHLIETLEATEKEIIEISLEQMGKFAGNMLQVRGAKSESYLVMSEQAYQSLTPAQIAKIKEHTNILHSPLYTIETYGGGSARCMMAEVFLTEK